MDQQVDADDNELAYEDEVGLLVEVIHSKNQDANSANGVYNKAVDSRGKLLPDTSFHTGR